MMHSLEKSIIMMVQVIYNKHEKEKIAATMNLVYLLSMDKPGNHEDNFLKFAYNVTPMFPKF